jgi:hypothetical protein
VYAKNLKFKMRDMGLTKSYLAFINTVQSYGLSNYKITDKYIIFDALDLNFLIMFIILKSSMIIQSNIGN